MRARLGTIVLAVLTIVLAIAPTAIAEPSPRDAIREKLRGVLNAAGKLSDVKATFKQSEKEPYNFIATIDDGLTHSEALEVVIRVTPNDTIGLRVYPHYKDGYINVDKAKDAAGLMRAMLLLTDHNFLFWGIDDEGDAFAGYTITLESGFPPEGVETVVRSIRNTDAFVGKLRPFIDGTGQVEE